MRILIASDFYRPLINGVATASRNLALGLAERGHDVVVLAPSQDGKKSLEKEDNYVIQRITSISFPLYQNIQISPICRGEVGRIIRDFQPDVIHVQVPMWIGLATMHHARRRGIPVVSTSHAMPDNLLDNFRRLAPLSRPIRAVLSSFGLRFHCRADVITSPTQSGVDSFGDLVQKVTRPIEVISNGIDLRDFTPGPVNPDIYTKFKLPFDRPIITYLGRLDAEKHLWVLLRAMQLVLQRHSAHLLIVGGGVDLENLRNLADELGITDQVTFTGPVSEEDKKALLRLGTVFCVPSPAELQCIAALEAMASGQPLVAVAAGALGELCLDGVDGYLFALDNHEEAAAALLKIITNPGLRDQMSQAALDLVRTHELSHTIDKYEELYARVIRQRAAS